MGLERGEQCTDQALVCAQGMQSSYIARQQMSREASGHVCCGVQPS